LGSLREAVPTCGGKRKEKKKKGKKDTGERNGRVTPLNPLAPYLLIPRSEVSPAVERKEGREEGWGEEKK